MRDVGSSLSTRKKETFEQVPSKITSEVGPEKNEKTRSALSLRSGQFSIIVRRF